MRTEPRAGPGLPGRPPAAQAPGTTRKAGISARVGPSWPPLSPTLHLIRPHADRLPASLTPWGRAASRGIEPSEWPQEGGQWSGPCCPWRCPLGWAAHLGHLLTVEAQGEAGTVVVQVAGARLARGAGQHRLLRSTRPPGRTGRLQALARGLLQAPLPRRALGAQGVRPASQQAGLLAAPHLGGTRMGPAETQHHAGRNTALIMSPRAGHPLPPQGTPGEGPPAEQGGPRLLGPGSPVPLPSSTLPG